MFVSALQLRQWHSAVCTGVVSVCGQLRYGDEQGGDFEVSLGLKSTQGGDAFFDFAEAFL